MKKSLLFLFLLVPAVLSAQVPGNWILEEPTGADLTVVQEATVVNEGSYSAKFSLLTNEVPYIFSANFDVTEESPYTFSIDLLDNTDQGSLKIYCEFLDADGQDIYGEDPVWSEDNASWQTISWSATVPAGAVKGYVWVKCYDDAGFTPPVDFYLDNASFTMNGGDNVIPNGGFENWSNFYETFKVDFNDGTIPADWLVINANEGANDNGKDGQRTWVLGEFGLEGTSCIFNDTYESDNENPADDWFVSPMVKLTDGYVLSFWADADADYPDSLIIWVSKTGQAPENFTILIDRLLVAGDFQKFSYVLTDHADLSEGDLVYIGFHNNTLGSYIDLDDIRYGELELPQIAGAWTVDQTSLDVLYDVPLSDRISPSVYELQGSASVTFSNAELDDSNLKIVHLTGGNANMNADMVVDSIKNTETNSSFKFYAGVSPIENTNVANPAGYLLRNFPATFKGIVMAKDVAGDRMWIQDGTDPRSGVNTYGGDVYEEAEVGDEIVITSINDPYQNQTELYQPTFITLLSAGNNLYSPVAISGSDIDTTIAPDSDPAEQFESMLVFLDNIKILDYQENDPESVSDNYYIATDDAGSHIFRIGNRLGVYPETFDDQLLVIGDIYNVIGIVVGRSGMWSVMPRSSSDFEFVSSGVGINDNYGLNLRVYPNPAMDNLRIEASGNLAGARLYSLSGILVKEITQNATSLSMDISNLSSGSYILKIETGEGESLVKRIMKR
ncbi:MAG: choice-of-anchor J domain-containing protein [Bacteroidales bacterium]|nr:choice-of-anchor J domain-containing protein [Bacteroidales bacterium]